MALGAIIGAATTIGSGIFGAMGQAEENRKNKKAAKKQNKYNKKVWRFNNSEQDRIYDFKVEEQEIAKRNYEADLKYQEDSRQQQWDYQMGIRDYQFSQEQRAYEESVSRATQQKTFNQLAEEAAMLEQQRYLQENMLNMAFTESQTMMDFAVATSGLELKKRQTQIQAGLTQAQLKGAAGLSKLSLTQEAELSKARGAAEAETALAQGMGQAEFAKQRTQAEAELALEQISAEAGSTKARDLAEAQLALEQLSGEAKFAKTRGRVEAETALGQIRGEAGLATARGEAEAELALAQLGGEAGLAKTRGEVEAEAAKQRIEADTKLRIKGARSQATLTQQRNTLEALKLSGTAKALGQAGRSARKVQQGIAAEAGANDAIVTAQYLLAEETALQSQFFDVLGIDRQLMFNNMDIDQREQFRRQSIEQQLYFNNLGIRQGEQFQSQNIRQQVLLNNADINQRQKYQARNIQQQVMLNASDIDQRARFQGRNIQQQALFNTADVNQQQLNQAQNIQQRLYFDTKTIDQQVGLESMAINQKLQYDQQNVVQQLLFSDQGIELDLTALNGQLEFDKLQMAAARDNLAVADAFNRKKIKLQRQQADLEAEANIRLKPEIAPPLPKPMALPRKEWTDVFRPGEMPEPNKVQAQVTNPYLTLGQSVLGGIGDLASAGAFDNMFGNTAIPSPTPTQTPRTSLDPLNTYSGFPNTTGFA